MPDDLRIRLVAAGVALLAERGADALTLREIARRTGVSHGAPRRCFPTHLDLLGAVARVGYDDLTARVAALPVHGDPARDLLALGRMYLAFARENRGMFELMFRHELLRGNKEQLREASRPLFGVLAERLDPSAAAPDSPEAGSADRDSAEAGGRSHAGTAAPHDPAAAGHDGPGAGDPIAAGAFWANLHGIAQLWSWGSLQMTTDSDDADALLRAAVAAYTRS